MNLKNIPVPEVYRESQDFRFFMEWFSTCLDKIRYTTENFSDFYDPLRCPNDLLWLLADTIGFRYDNRLSVACNRLILVYFMSMIYNRGSKLGMMLAAEVNLAQFCLGQYATGYTDSDGNEVKGDEIYYSRLEDTSVPVNAVYVTPHTKDGYIDIVYFSDKLPIDACTEYVRPLGMFLFQHKGAVIHSKTSISVDARLTNTNDMRMDIGPTFVGHYRRDDYARMQKTVNQTEVSTTDTRKPVWYRNSKSEDSTSTEINPGYRALNSLQLSNNENIMRSLFDPIFSLGFGPQSVDVTYPDDYLKNPDKEQYNLRYDSTTDAENTVGNSVETIDKSKSADILHPYPAVNTPMTSVGGSMST